MHVESLQPQLHIYTDGYRCCIMHYTNAPSTILAASTLSYEDGSCANKAAIDTGCCTLIEFQTFTTR
jgi:hypothetical protein